MGLVICHLRKEERNDMKYRIDKTKKGLYIVKYKVPFLPIWLKCKDDVFDKTIKSRQYNHYIEALYFIKYKTGEITRDTYINHIQKWWYYYE